MSENFDNIVPSAVFSAEMHRMQLRPSSSKTIPIVPSDPNFPSRVILSTEEVELGTETRESSTREIIFCSNGVSNFDTIKIYLSLCDPLTITFRFPIRTNADFISSLVELRNSSLNFPALESLVPSKALKTDTLAERGYFAFRDFYDCKDLLECSNEELLEILKGLSHGQYLLSHGSTGDLRIFNQSKIPEVAAVIWIDYEANEILGELIKILAPHLGFTELLLQIEIEVDKWISKLKKLCAERDLEDSTS